ncbi:MAG: acetate--CoA ligase family protein [Elusimicrobiaceae bacterium]
MNKVRDILAKAFSEGRRSLSEAEVYSVFDSLGLDTPKRTVIPLSAGGESFLKTLPGSKVVIKVSSSKTLHKTEAGGVKICSLEEAASAIAEMKKKFPDAEGLLLSEFVEHAAFALGQELMLGARFDSGFGPVITLGVGGTDAEAFTKALRPGTSPAIESAYALETDGDFREFLDSAWVWKYAAGKVRGGKRIAEDAVMLKWLKAFTALVREFAGKKDWLIEEIEVNPLAVSNGRAVALDGVLRFKPAAEAEPERVLPSAKGVQSLLRPRTMAIAGVSETKINMGRIILRNIIEAGFPKEKLFVLKDFAGEIEGVKCYASPKDFPDQVDMFVVSVPGATVPDLLKETAESGKVNGLVLISGGMGEKEGTQHVHRSVVDMIARARAVNPDFALSGGNSLGIVSNPSRVNTLFIPKEKMLPPLGENPHNAKTAFISQSGAFVINITSKYPAFKPVYCVTVGNQMDVTVVDYAAQAELDHEITALFLYLEGLKPGDGLRLVETVERAVKDGKRVAVYKAGRTLTGQKAVMGHTASIAGSFVVAKSMLSKAGAFVAETLEEFEDYIQLCANFGKYESGPRAFLLSNAGFESAAMADNLELGGPIDPVYPSEALKGKLAQILKESRLDGIVDVNNPFDVTPMAPDIAMSRAAEEILKSGEYDSLIVSPVPLTATMKTLPSENLEESLPVKLAELSRKYEKPVIFCVAAGDIYNPYRDIAVREGLAVFKSADRALRALSAFSERHAVRE